ncbi:hypothetical protein [Alterisphingorhabdus coralli]|uniref:Uncharacterized protein n=1 Tax=Alterisphingorhabdus coralli TaxID=3071408 RepID=A0AA97F9M7_9SPHN|nr:hypothetical protein [Parasphingorhabdus sp. SCSIO 66989]WOE76471.1 hypothetical protein RB602_07090 [Parasphingorhabdus sp. SCSIO 66989]
MQDPNTILIVTAAALLGITILAASALRAWNDWIALKRMELRQGPVQETEEFDPHNTNARIELADLRERLRKLEAIAAGVEL